MVRVLGMSSNSNTHLLSPSLDAAHDSADQIVSLSRPLSPCQEKNRKRENISDECSEAMTLTDQRQRKEMREVATLDVRHTGQIKQKNFTRCSLWHLGNSIPCAPLFRNTAKMSFNCRKRESVFFCPCNMFIF